MPTRLLFPPKLLASPPRKVRVLNPLRPLPSSFFQASLGKHHLSYCLLPSFIVSPSHNLLPIFVFHPAHHFRGACIKQNFPFVSFVVSFIPVVQRLLLNPAANLLQSRVRRLLSSRARSQAVNTSNLIGHQTSSMQKAGAVTLTLRSA